MRKYGQIAIDGPVAAGKSTVAKLVAAQLGFTYVDTGAMYRALALAAQEHDISWNNEEGIGRLIAEITIDLQPPNGGANDGRGVTVFLDGRDVSWAIRTTELGEGASIVSQYPVVRTVMGNLQQQIASNRNVVMEGRDIGTRILPKATLKIYMDADLNVRAQRKQEQLKKLGQQLSLEEVKEGIVSRDQREMSRAVDPLKPAADAVVLDTTDLAIGDVVATICELFRAKRETC